MATNNLVTTAQGLTRVSRELIDKRSFNRSLVKIEGDPIIDNGILSSISSTSYTYQTDLVLSKASTLKIHATGTYYSLSTPQCLWSLEDITVPEQVSAFGFLVYQDRVELTYNNVIVFSINNLNFSQGNILDTTLELTGTSYKLSLVYNNKYSEFEGQNLFIIDFKKCSTVCMGNTKIQPSQYWTGSIDLTKFLLYVDNTLVYTPSDSPFFKFTKMLVSDGEYPLTDNSTEIVSHIYSFDITELSRSGNNILLKSTVGSKVHLDIKEVGLYVEGVDGETLLFALVSGTSIKKSSIVEYELVFNVNLSVNIVNTVATPKITVKEEAYESVGNFNRVKENLAYSVNNLESIATKDSLTLGRSGVLELFRTMTNARIWANNCAATQRNSRIAEYIHPSITPVYDETKTIKKGNPTISSSGELSNITADNYLYTLINSSMGEPWEMNLEFTTDGVTPSDQTVFNFYSNTVNQPIVVGVNSSNQVYVKMGQLEEIGTRNSLSSYENKYMREPSLDKTLNNTNYYAWTSVASVVNPHVNITGNIVDINGTMSNFSSSNFANIVKKVTLNNNSELVFGFNIGSGLTTGTYYTLMEAKEGHTFAIRLKDKHLYYSIGNGTTWTYENLMYSNLSQELVENRNYLIRVTYGYDEEHEYYRYLSEIEDTTALTPSFTTDFSQDVGAAPEFTLRFGISSDGTSYWANGTTNNQNINIGQGSLKNGTTTSWTGVRQTNVLYSTSIAPTTTEVLCDPENYVFEKTKVFKRSANVLLNRTLLSVAPYTKVYLKIVFTGNSYIFKSSPTGAHYSTIDTFNSSSLINAITNLYFGVTKTQTSATSRFAGTIQLVPFELVVGGTTYRVSKDNIKETKLKDYYSLYKYPYNYYNVKNLSGLENSNILINDGMLKGRMDEIDFSGAGGSLYLTLELEDKEDKVILTKSNKSTLNYYFILRLVNRTLRFTVYLETGVINLQKVFTDEELERAVNEKISLCVTCTGTSKGNPYFYMYIGDTLVDQVESVSSRFLNAPECSLANYLMEHPTADTVYVRNIISFNGALTANEVYYLNRLLDI